MFKTGNNAMKNRFASSKDTSPRLRFVSLACLSVAILGCTKVSTIAPLDDSRIEATGVIDGATYHLADDGNAYQVIDDGKRWALYKTVYKPEDFAKSYHREGDSVFRVDPDTGRQFPTIRRFEESFEGFDEGTIGLKALVSEARLRWGSFTLQSPATPTIPSYVDLRTRILNSDDQFLDSRIEPSRERFYSGQASLKCVALAKSSDMITSKASLSSPLIYFGNQDDLWFEAFYYVEGAMPLTIADFECEFVDEHPGIRIRVFDDKELGMELKALGKPQFRQPAEKAIAFPSDRWVKVRLHLKLAPQHGMIELWQDDQKVLETSGPTLPFRSAIYNSLEVGISAHSTDVGDSVLFVDDLRISDREFE